MSVFTDDMFEDGEPRTCDYCGKGVTKWINICPGGNLCAECAQVTMRRIFEDLIEFHNPGKAHVSLLGIMLHGYPRKEKRRDDISEEGVK